MLDLLPTEEVTVANERLKGISDPENVLCHPGCDEPASWVGG